MQSLIIDTQNLSTGVSTLNEIVNLQIPSKNLSLSREEQVRKLFLLPYQVK